MTTLIDYLRIKRADLLASFGGQGMDSKEGHLRAAISLVGYLMSFHTEIEPDEYFDLLKDAGCSGRHIAIAIEQHGADNDE